MSLTSVRIELAPKGTELYQQASTVLEAFGDEFPLDEYYIDGDEQLPIVCVGYAGDVAVTAATCYEETTDIDASETGTPFIGLPRLEVALIATDEVHRRNGYAKQLVSTIFSLAINHGFDHVQADPKDNDAILFWGDCGFKLLPRGDSGDSDMHRSVSGIEVVDTGIYTSVSAEVKKRLSDFTMYLKTVDITMMRPPSLYVRITL